MDPQQQAAEKADRLLTLANVHRMRGNVSEAVRLCQEVLELAPENDAAHEMLGDLQVAQGQLEAAMAHFRKAFEIGKRPATEEKIALLALRLANQQHGLPGAGTDMAPAARKHLNPSMACLLSLLFPGLGQLYNGEYRKGFLLIALWLALSYNLYYVVKVLLGPITGGSAGLGVPPSAWLVGLVQVGVLIYALVDASLSAVAINRSGTPRAKSGWEV